MRSYLIKGHPLCDFTHKKRATESSSNPGSFSHLHTEGQSKHVVKVGLSVLESGWEWVSEAFRPSDKHFLRGTGAALGGFSTWQIFSQECTDCTDCTYTWLKSNHNTGQTRSVFTSSYCTQNVTLANQIVLWQKCVLQAFAPCVNVHFSSSR